MYRLRALLQAVLSASFWMAVVMLFGASIFFTYEVQGRRLKTAAAVLPAGVSLELTQAVDGDEVIVASADLKNRVRLLGIKSFEPTVTYTPALNRLTRAAFKHLKDLQGKKVRLVYDSPDTDRRNRLLAFVYSEGKDVGLELVSRGHSVVFEKYPFDEMAAYLEAEKEARQKKRGIWAVKKLVNQVESLKVKWRKEAK